MCLLRDPGVLLRAAPFTAGYVRWVGQEPAPRKCVLMSTSRAVRADMCRWVVTDEGHRYLGRHLNTTFRGWSANPGYAGSTGHCSAGSDFCSSVRFPW